MERTQNQFIKNGVIAILVITLFSSCKKYIEVEPPYTSANGENVYTTDATAISAVTSMYTQLGIGTASGGFPINYTSLTYHTGLCSDELTLYSGNTDLAPFYKNDLSAATAPLYWQQLYGNIYLANSAIEGLSESTTITAAVKQQLLGEAKFMRAFCYFYLINLYGDVPLVINTNHKSNSLSERTVASVVWQQIITDLSEAKDLMNLNYVGADIITGSTTTERVRPNKGGATALLARTYLYVGDYTKAEAQATELISNTATYDTVSLNNAFLKDPKVNKEAIWQIQGVTTGWNTNEARFLILPSAGPGTTNPVYLNKRLVSSFELNDKRRTNWVKGIKVGADSFYYAYKYKSATLNAPVTEYLTIFRLSEQYLIRAEARAQQNKISEAQNDLNVIRKRAGLANTTANDKPSLLTSILNERRFEMFCEWGHRWLDLKRTNKIDDVMRIETPLKGGTWQSFDSLYPITLDELIANPNLSQTPGY
jgi:hypothetical protein